MGTNSQMENRMTASVGAGGGGIEQKEKGLMDMDNSVVTAGGGWVKGTEW